MPATRARRCLLRLTVVLFAGLAPAVGSDKPLAATAAHTAAADQQGVAASYYYHPEVRLRKLHLVRPDLIPYPLAYDVYC
jgi:hypothetical protein